MNYNKNFNLDEILRILGTVNDTYQEGSSEDEALRIAAVALTFVQHNNQLGEFREFFQKFYSPDYALRPSHAFPSQKEADEWLHQGTARDGELVSIAGQGFQVVLRPTRSFFLRTPLLEELRQAKEKK